MNGWRSNAGLEGVAGTLVEGGGIVAGVLRQGYCGGVADNRLEACSTGVKDVA